MTIPTITLRDTGQTLDAITYLKGVLPSEMPASWPIEALKAQCVAAASYAASKNWTVWSDTRDQAYDASRRTPKTDAVVESMAGALLWQGNAPARAFYSAFCGGLHLNAWGGHLRAGRCYCNGAANESAAALANSRYYQRDGRWYGGGHRNGLCQQGAHTLARMGYTWDQILAWYYDLGDSVSLRGGWGQAPLWEPPAAPVNRITLHTQLRNYHRWLIESLARLAGRVEYIVCIDPPMDTNPFPHQRVLDRAWIGGDDKEQAMIDKGAAGADEYWAAIRGQIPAYTYAVLGPNEPRIETQRDRLNLVAFYRRFVELVHGAGFLVAGPNLGVGRMGDDHALRAAGWSWLDSMRVAAHELAPLFAAVDIATDHAYGRRSGADWTGWDDWTLRMRLFVRHLPIEVQRRLVWVCTEGGLDIAGGRECGWRGPGGPSEERYVAQIMEANRRLPPFVHGYCLFTAIPNDDWRSFDVTEPLWRGLEQEMMKLPMGTIETDDDIVPEIVAMAHDVILPLNPDAALYKAARLRDARLMPASNEFTPKGHPDIVAQSFRRADEPAMICTVWTRKGEWAPEQMRWIQHAN